MFKKPLFWVILIIIVAILWFLYSGKNKPAAPATNSQPAATQPATTTPATTTPGTTTPATTQTNQSSNAITMPAAAAKTANAESNILNKPQAAKPAANQFTTTGPKTAYTNDEQNA